MRLIYHPHAEGELIEAAQFYEQKVPGLGAQFLAAVEIAVSAIQQTPERWRIVEADIRRYLMHQFPYAIYYRAFPEELRILAFKHHSRHPDYWRHRLSD